MISKRTVMVGAIGGMTIGSLTPFLWGDYNSFGVLSILLGMLGGFIGIFIAVKLSQWLS